MISNPTFDAITCGIFYIGNKLFGTIKWLVNPLFGEPVTPKIKYNGHPKTVITKIAKTAYKSRPNTLETF